MTGSGGGFAGAHTRGMFTRRANCIVVGYFASYLFPPPLVSLAGLTI